MLDGTDTIAPTRRDMLRHATDAAHRRLDAAMGVHDLSDPAGYRAFLAAHARALPALEDALARGGFAAALPGWAEGRRTAALWADLRGMGAAVAPMRHAALSGGAAWGAAYVLEGSRLGARVLLRRAQAGGSAEVAANTRFLSHGGGVRWRAFLDALEAALADDAAAVQARIGACAAFALFETEAMEAIQ